MDYLDQIFTLIESAGYNLSNLKPSEWAEKYRTMSTEESPRPGKFSFDYTPYGREVLDTLSYDHPAIVITIMKGAQIGFSTNLIENAIGFIISQSPGNILFLTGHSDLSDEAMSGKIDRMIESCGLRSHIRPNVIKKKNQRTGDTNKAKEFAGGSLVAGSAGNHKLLKQRSVRYIFVDDFDAAKKSTKESGSTMSLIEHRAAAYADKSKIYLISTPEVKQTSNIEPEYLKGDQRKYHVPCPCCGDYIILYWSIEFDGKTYGINYEVDEKGKLVEGSVGYLCQSCGEKFSEKHKQELLINGEWRPTAKPSQPGYYSYQISALYSPPGMTNWTQYVRKYLEANPKDAPQNVRLMQTFTNLVLGETFEDKGEAPKANALQRNVRTYEVGDVPEKISQEDGNGSIVLLTCACDLNGKVDDARLDYEIVAWSETGASYSVQHGSIGTFIPNESHKKNKVDREHWTYRIGEAGNVWDSFTEMIESTFKTDTGRSIKIGITGVDTGNTYLNNAYAYVESQDGRNYVIGVKGDNNKYRRYGIDTKTFRPARERSDLWLFEVNQLKDELADLMKLRWSHTSDVPQPPGFLNFPIPSGGLYTFRDYFGHFESEHRIIKNKEGQSYASRWEKKNSSVQNHLWDCRIYNMGLRDIYVYMSGKAAGITPFAWKDYVDLVLGRLS